MTDNYLPDTIIDTPQLLETIVLPNELKLEAWDLSRKIAGDRFQITLAIRIEVDLDRDFSPQSDHEHDIARELRAEAGNIITYEFRDQRNFIAADRKDAVLRELFDAFKKDSLPYLASPLFGRRFVLSMFSKLKKDPFRFRTALRKSFFHPRSPI